MLVLILTNVIKIQQLNFYINLVFHSHTINGQVFLQLKLKCLNYFFKFNSVFLVASSLLTWSLRLRFITFIPNFTQNKISILIKNKIDNYNFFTLK
jgi:hypothetical protein